MKQISKLTVKLLLLSIVAVSFQFIPSSAKASEASVAADFASRELAVAQSKVVSAVSLVERVIAQQNYLDLQAKYEKVLARAARTKSSVQSRSHQSSPELQAKADPKSGNAT